MVDLIIPRLSPTNKYILSPLSMALHHDWGLDLCRPSRARLSGTPACVKLNIVGGEPSLYPGFPGQLLRFCKEVLGLESSSIISTGDKIRAGVPPRARAVPRYPGRLVRLVRAGDEQGDRARSVPLIMLQLPELCAVENSRMHHFKTRGRLLTETRGERQGAVTTWRRCPASPSCAGSTASRSSSTPRSTQLGRGTWRGAGCQAGATPVGRSSSA